MTHSDAQRTIHDSPGEFARVFLGMTPDAVQRPILESVAANPRTAARTGNGVGKTFSAAVIVLWFLLTRRPSVVVTTASTWRQVSKQLWAEINRLYRIADATARGKLALPQGVGGKCDQAQLSIAPDHFAIGVSTDDPGLFEGFHSEHILVVVDEAKSVAQGIFDAVERLLSTGAECRLLVCSTPGGPTGPFYDCFTDQAGLYQRHHISGWDSPRVNDSWCTERREQWGETNPLYLSAVCGEFAHHSDDTLISLAWVEAAIQRQQDTAGDVWLGVDLARFGSDETVLAVLRGTSIVEIETYHGKDLMETCGRVRRMMDAHQIPAEQVNVDDTGLGCLVPGTEVLCEDGWKPIESIIAGESVYSQGEDGYVELASVDRVELREDVEIVQSGDYEFSATHLVPHKARAEQPWQLHSWAEVVKRKQFWVDVMFQWKGIYPSLELPAHRIEMPHGGINKVWPEQRFSGEPLMRFLAWFIAEGHISTAGRGRGSCIGITQSQISRWNDDIEAVLGECGLHFSRKLTGGREYQYLIWNIPLLNFLKENCYLPGTCRTSHRLRVPGVVSQATPEMIDVFLDEYVKGDGWIHKGARNISTSSAALRDDLQMLMFKAGHYGTIRQHSAPGSTGTIDGRTITRKASNWRVAEWKGCSTTHTPEKLQQRRGDVFYIAVDSPSRLIFCRLKSGRILWTHNGGVTDRLHELNLRVNPVNNGSKAHDDHYVNLGAEAWWGVRDRLATGSLTLPDDDVLTAQLVGRKYKYRSDGKLALEGKDEMTKRGVGSPDRADAVVLACYRPQVVELPQVFVV